MQKDCTVEQRLKSSHQITLKLESPSKDKGGGVIKAS